MISWPLLVTYCILALFATQQKFAYREFRGLSVMYHACLGFITFLTVAFTGGFFVYVGYRTTWWWPVVLYALGALVYVLLCRFSFIRSRFAVSIWALASFLGVPICAVLLIHFTP